MARALPDERTWRELRDTLDEADRKRIRRATWRSEVMAGEDDAYLAVAYTRHLIPRIEWAPLWLTASYVLLSFLLDLLLFRDVGRAAQDLLGDWLILFFLPVFLSYLWLVRLHRLERANVNVLWSAAVGDGASEARSS